MASLLEFDPRVVPLSRYYPQHLTLLLRRIIGKISCSLHSAVQRSTDRRWWCNKSGRSPSEGKRREGKGREGKGRVGALHNSQRTIGFVNKLQKPGRAQSALRHPSIRPSVHPSLNAVLIGSAANIFFLLLCVEQNRLLLNRLEHYFTLLHLRCVTNAIEQLRGSEEEYSVCGSYIISFSSPTKSSALHTAHGTRGNNTVGRK